MKRILPSKRIRKGIDELLKEGTKGDLPDRCRPACCIERFSVIELSRDGHHE
jgi:hypothetical protein